VNEWPLQLAKHQGRFDDLIFSPLDLPAPPEIDAGRFVQWMQLGQQPETSLPRVAFENLTGQSYPWLLRSLIGDLSALAEAFPEVHRYLLCFPFKQVKSLTFLAQHGTQEVFTHTDSDDLYGMRFYLTVKNSEGLHFFKAKERYDHFPTYARSAEGVLQRADWDKHFWMSQPMYATLPAGCRTFVLNNSRAAHAVAANTCVLGERIAVLVRGEFDTQARDALLARSVAKHAAHALWFDQPVGD
jgi:hypothetical protein